MAKRAPTISILLFINCLVFYFSTKIVIKNVISKPLIGNLFVGHHLLRVVVLMGIVMMAQLVGDANLAVLKYFRLVCALRKT